MGVPKVLVVSYVFPPNSGIGGRRWAKFSKYLYRMGADVKVLTFNNENINGNNGWIKDIEEYKNRIECVKPNKPFFLKNKNPKSIFNKLKYRLSIYWKQLNWNANYYDETVSMQTQFLELLDKYYKNGYNNIIITCAPFLLSYYGGLFKSIHPNVNLILDFRDPWTNNQMGYQYRFLPPKRLDNERQLEKFAINNANYVYAVNNTMVNYFNSLINSNNFYTVIKRINNGFDIEDKKTDNTVLIRSSKKLSFVFAGSLYENLDYILIPFMEAIKKLSKLDGIENKVEFVFYSKINNDCSKYFKENNILFIKNPLSLDEIHEVINNASAGLLFLTKDLVDSFSTKFYEYLMYRKYILVFSEKGETGDFVFKYDIGKQILPNDIYGQLLKIIENPDVLSFNKTFDVSEFDVAKIAQNIYIDLMSKES